VCTIAYLAVNEEIQYVHLAEALQYWPKLMPGQKVLDKNSIQK
jgi:hypothetical protein